MVTKSWLLAVMVLCILAPPPGVIMAREVIPLPARAALKKAHGFLEEKKVSRAIEALESFQAKGSEELKNGHPDGRGYRHYLICFALGNCYLMSGRLSDAISQFESAVDTKPDYTPAWLNLAKSCYDLNEFAKAGSCFQKAYEISEEKKPEWLYYSASSFVAANDNRKALEVLHSLLVLHKDSIKLEWKEILVQAYLADDQPHKALPYIEELSEKTSGKKRKQWQEVLLNQYLSLGMKKKAIDYAQWLTREYPLESKWWKCLAHLHLKENIYNKALVALTIYGYLTPLSKQEKKLVADLNMTMDIPIQSTRLYEEILAERPDTGIVKRVAQSYMRRHMPGDALKWVEKGLLHVSDADLWMLKGNLLYEMEMYEEAMNVFETAAGIMSRPGQAWLMMGYAAWKEGFIEISRQAFKRASKSLGQKDAAQSALCQLAKSESL